jgi:hypothetical protein
MTDTAIKSLSQNPNGFFLMVEGASIDKQLHVMDWQRGIYDAIEMDKALGVAKKFQQQNPDTLILVTADHSHSLSIYGTYSEEGDKKGADAVGVYAEAKFPTFTYTKNDGFPDSPDPNRTLAIGWANHPEYIDNFGKFYKQPVSPTIEDPNNKGKYIANPKRSDIGPKVPSNLPPTEASEVHTADDVPVLGSGPGSELVNGVLDNTDLFFVMTSALGLDPTATNGRSTLTSFTGGTIGDPTNPLAKQGATTAANSPAASSPAVSGVVANSTAATTNSSTSTSTSGNSDVPVILWIVIAIVALALGFGGGIFTSRAMAAKK